MSEKDLELQRHNRVREVILRILLPNYPSPMDAKLLRIELSNLSFLMSDKDLRFYLAYLKEKGFVVLDDKPDYGISMVKITALGIDALDGRVIDCGIGC